MGFKLILLRVLFWIVPLFIFTGCGDLEPDMQNTRTVSLNMDFHGKSSSRSSSSVSAAELSQYNTHLILALPSWEYLTSNYKDFYSSFAQGLMNTADNKVSLEIPLNTQMKIFAFLFEESYNTLTEFDSGTRTLGYYGESDNFTIGKETNNLSLGICLIQVPGTPPCNAGGTETADTAAPIIEQVTAIESPISVSTPVYTFASTKAGIITYGGSCDSATIIATIGNNTIIFNALIDGTYSDCKIKVTDSEGNESNSLTIPTFTVDTTVPVTTAPIISGVSSGTFTTSQTFTVSGESGATIEYSLDGGSIWNAYSAAVTLTSEGSYTITARQRSDAAGNWSANATYVTVEINQSTTTSCTAVSSCSATPSGNFYVNNGTLSGIYDYFLILALTGETGFDNSTGCASNSSYISGRGPTGTQSVIIQEVITSSTTFATKAVYYSDTACSSEIASMVIGYDNVTVGDNVTGLTTSIGNKTYPSSASEVTYKESCMELKGTTDVGRDYLNDLISSSFVTTGETHTCQGSGESKHALWAADNSSVSWESLHKEESSTAEYPGDWSSDTDSSTKLQSVTDIDGNVYRTVVIGDQHWMAENLKVTKYRNGDNITNITVSSDWGSDTSGAYGVYVSSEIDATTYLDSYGRLYNWYAVDNSSSRYICPEGWHVPTADEYDVLSTYLGGNSVAGGKIKEPGTDHWNSPNVTGADNETSGFNARGAGYRPPNGSYGFLKQTFVFWTVSYASNSNAYYRSGSSSNGTLTVNSINKKYGFSVRCLED